METILHIYHPKRNLLLLEYANKSTNFDPSTGTGTGIQEPSNVLLFVGGLYDNFRSPAYIEDVAALFPRDFENQKWRVMHVQMSSSGRTFGLYDLDRDVDEISTAITYIRSSITHSPDTPVVLMGHSTGCQDLIHYLSTSTSSPSPSRPRISGAIFQAPVSDREAIMDGVHSDPATRQSYEACLAIATSTPTQHHATTILPIHVSKLCLGSAPLSIARFLSLASPGSPDSPGMDDYYSSDLSDARLSDTFGRIGSSRGTAKTVMFLPSGSDEHVPMSIDKEFLLSRWKRAVEADGAASVSQYSRVIRNALHDISGSSIEARTARLVDMRGSVLRYLDEVVGDILGDAEQRGQGEEIGKGGADGAATRHQTDSSPWAIYERDRRAIELERGVSGVRL
ncbi:hypothetical protein A1O1_02272 [Capronia coronata CBS 617.96]|uniref:Uncharacterized protein n=1 Tax=Capronia coronata CBS 617.96 TaxID=1182541 RepID=W9ZHE0_9EURO|nr:uncharacterized protein A1O1_02272 [Capronia coronata CBS 617.96]EXJ93879.1 hypothetical protein A1O1_02272 [Capronia coronata CBS 617.96]